MVLLNKFNTFDNELRPVSLAKEHIVAVSQEARYKGSVPTKVCAVYMSAGAIFVLQEDEQNSTYNYLLSAVSGLIS